MASKAVFSAVILLLCAAAPLSALESPRTPLDVLKSSLGGPPPADFTGTKIIWSEDADGNRREFSSRIWHNEDGRERELFKDKNGDTVKIVLRREAELYVWKAGEGPWQESSAEWESRHPLENVTLIGKNYRLKRDDTVYLQRKCIVIHADSPSTGRPAFKAVIDAETLVPLAVELTRPGGKETFGYRFTEVSYTASDDSLFEIPVDHESKPARGVGGQGESFTSVSEAKGRVGFDVLDPMQVPAGFTVTGCRTGLRPWKSENYEGLTIRLSDGLSAISIYEWASEGGTGDDGKHKFTEVTRGGRSVIWGRHGMDFLLITTVGGTRAAVFGEVPLQELLDMAFSLEPVK